MGHFSKTSLQGITLLETLLAAVLFSITAVGAAAIISSANLSTARSSQRLAGDLLATRMLEGTIDEARTGGAPQPESGQFQIRSVRRGQENTVVYDYQVEVVTLASGVRDVTVRVTWVYKGENQTVFREVLVYPTS